GKRVGTINPNLTTATDVTQARALSANARLAYMGDTKGGAFDIEFETAQRMLEAPNVNGRPSSDVVVPWCNGLDVTRRLRGTWIIDFGTSASEETASLYEAPFAHARLHVFPERKN